MSTINLRSALIRYNGYPLMGIIKRIYKMADVHTKLYIENLTNADLLEKGLGMQGVTLAPIDTTKAPVAQDFNNRSYFRKFCAQIKALIKDLNAGKIFIYDPKEYPCITTRFPNALEAMYNGIEDGTEFDVETGEIDDTPVVLIKAPTGVTPKTGDYSFYGADSLKAIIGETEKEVSFLNGNIVVVPDTEDEFTSIVLSLPGFADATITMPD